ncbi:hypothetical protein AOQ84DRAFT_3662 [Glonium stellatum]|uniref:Uncharacterized protein n=1 Tax=Glonium stellatum TaxID=574774 RepID=A0A8E2F4D1_9PEZI|nr:hypothetical protein AOQ84DRAFT_3662 [Glonium stellatum]
MAANDGPVFPPIASLPSCRVAFLFLPATPSPSPLAAQHIIFLFYFTPLMINFFSLSPPHRPTRIAPWHRMQTATSSHAACMSAIWGGPGSRKYRPGRAAHAQPTAASALSGFLNLHFG